MVRFHSTCCHSNGRCSIPSTRSMVQPDCWTLYLPKSTSPREAVHLRLIHHGSPGLGQSPSMPILYLYTTVIVWCYGTYRKDPSPALKIRIPCRREQGTQGGESDSVNGACRTQPGGKPSNDHDYTAGRCTGRLYPG